jgi:hypothetical protein
MGTPPIKTVTGFKDGGGSLLRQAKLVLIFWGTAWNGNPTPSATAVVDAITSILSSPYMFKLQQYRGIGNASLLAVDIADQSDPPNPFSNEDVLTFLGQRMQSGAIPPSNTTADAFYCVIMPQGTATSETASDGTQPNGAHYSWAGITRFCWVRNDGTLRDRGSVPKVLMHELVEACSDADDGSGIVLTVKETDVGQEICDVCNQVVLFNGIAVPRYWSQFDLSCEAPQQRSVAWYLRVLGATGAVSLRSLTAVRGTNSLVRLLSLPGLP